MTKGLLKLYEADIVWDDPNFIAGNKQTVIMAVPDRYYEDDELPEGLDTRIFYYLDVGTQPVAPKHFGDFTVTKFSDDYEEAWFEIEEKGND
jgi:hypothetical protein